MSYKSEESSSAAMENNVRWNPEAPHLKTLTWTNQAKLRTFAIMWVVTVLKLMRVNI